MLTVRSKERIRPAAITRNALNFTRDKPARLTIRRIEPGAVKIGDETVRENVLIFRDEIQRGIAIDDVATLSEQQLDDLLCQQPEIVILGTGWEAHQPPRELVFAMARRGVGFETMDTPAACRTFNILLSEGRDVAAILVIRE
jgi:uncharacterized protein